LKIRLIALVGAVLALALIAAGCGDDDDTSTTTLTKAQFVKQGNAICEAGNKEIDSEFEQFADENKIDQSKPPTDAQLEEVAEEFLLPSISKQIDEIRALGAPEGDEDSVNAFLDSAEAEVEEIEGDPGLLAGDAFTEVNKEARAIGLVACAEG
jgi:hypothetical protein